MSTPFDLYQTVTDQVLAMLDAGVVPWRSPILTAGPAGRPKNLASGRPYRGVNVFLLAFAAFERGYASPNWVTFNQARAAGGMVRKGEKSSMVVFWKQYEAADRKTGEPTRIPVLRYYNVFNADQCDGLADAGEVATVTPATDVSPVEKADAILAGFEGKPPIEVAGTRAYYRPATDTVTMPGSARFVSTEAYYATLFHELAHNAASRIMPRPARLTADSRRVQGSRAA
jgi:antirestriction protein ArdC